MKICTRCGEEKKDDDFSFKNKSTNKRSSACKVCQRVYHKEYYKDNKEVELKRSIVRKNIIKEWFREYKRSLNCCRCDEKHIATLQFHHLNPKEKEYSVSHMPSNGCSKNKILKEISKCIVLCANCHAKEHYDGE